MEGHLKDDNMLQTKEELLNKLRDYTTTPDDDNIHIKEKIKSLLLHTPELLYALNEPELEKELFDEDGNINWDEDGEPIGEWDKYFGNESNIRPFIFFPEVQTDMKNYVCYTTSFDEIVRHNSSEKYLYITFTIFVYGVNGIDELTGIPRHDLIASIIREKIAWKGNGLALSNAIPISDKESTTDNNFIVRTMIFRAQVPNSLSVTKNGSPYFVNKGR